MADEDKQEPEAAPEQSPDKNAAEQEKPKSSLKLFGGTVGFVGAGVMLAVMATPLKEVVPVLKGPARYTLLKDGDIVGNPFDGDFKRLVKFTPSCDYFAYDLAYPESRRMDPHYETLLKETMQLTVADYSMNDVMAGSTREMFMAALEEVAEPILFPVHVGSTVSPFDTDEASGLRIGHSQERRGTFRGTFYDHVLKVSHSNRTIQLDEAGETSFSGQEHDLRVETDDGSELYVDVSNLTRGFEGEVNVGVMGRIRRVLTGDIIAQ